MRMYGVRFVHGRPAAKTYHPEFMFLPRRDLRVQPADWKPPWLFVIRSEDGMRPRLEIEDAARNWRLQLSPRAAPPGLAQDDE
jgi:hypothetical protein